jgi:hypothetical protein
LRYAFSRFIRFYDLWTIIDERLIRGMFLKVRELMGAGTISKVVSSYSTPNGAWVAGAVVGIRSLLG